MEVRYLAEIKGWRKCEITLGKKILLKLLYCASQQKYIYCRIHLPNNFDHNALQIYSHMLYTFSTVSISSVYSNNAVKTRGICYSAVIIFSNEWHLLLTSLKVFTLNVVAHPQNKLVNDIAYIVAARNSCSLTSLAFSVSLCKLTRNKNTNSVLNTQALQKP